MFNPKLPLDYMKQNVFKACFIFIFLILFNTFLVAPGYSASNTTVTQARSIYQRQCTKNFISTFFAISCYLFDVADEIKLMLENIMTHLIENRQTTSAQQQEILSLKARIEILENIHSATPVPSSAPTPSPDLRPFEVEFSMDNSSSLRSFTASANKSIRYCTFTAGTQSLAITTNGSISANICSQDNINSPILNVIVESFEGEFKTWGF